MAATRAITRIQDADDVAAISGQDGKWLRLSSGAFVFATPTAADVGAAPLASAAGIERAFFGDGSDGDVTVSGSTTLTRDMYYNNLTIGAAGSLNCAGFRVFVKATLTINTGGVIHYDVQAASGGGGGTFSTVNSLGRGGVGANGPTGAGAAGSAPTGAGNSLAFGGNGGAGGAGSGGAGGAAGTLAAPNTSYGALRAGVLPLWGSSTNAAGTVGSVMGGAGGGSGGGDGSATGGGGGAGGNVVLINAKTIVNNGTIRANGGNGAARGFGTNPGGGGGGGGGVVIVNSAAAVTGSGSITANGGSGGAGTGTGSAGSAGSPGTVVTNVWA